MRDMLLDILCTTVLIVAVNITIHTGTTDGSQTGLAMLAGALFAVFVMIMRGTSGR